MIRIVNESELSDINPPEVQVSLRQNGDGSVSIRVKRGQSTRMEVFNIYERKDGTQHVNIFEGRLKKFGFHVYGGIE